MASLKDELDATTLDDEGVRGDIAELRAEAVCGGDLEMVGFCDRALEGDATALRECLDALVPAFY
jgi:hypothetical protein